MSRRRLQPRPRSTYIGLSNYRALSGTIGFAASDVLAVAPSVGAGSPVGITIGAAAAPPFSPPLSMSFGGQDKPAGGQLVLSLDRANISLGSPTFVTSLLFVLLLLLSAFATPGDASATTTATIPASATRRPLLIRSCCAYVLTLSLQLAVLIWACKESHG